VRGARARLWREVRRVERGVGRADGGAAGVASAAVAHLRGVRAALDAIDPRALAGFVALLEAARERGATIFVAGNGGSATTASHFVCDLLKRASVPGRPRLRALALGDNAALLTAWANDRDYAHVFAEPLENYARPGDVLVAISTSGNSASILRAAEVAAAHALAVVALTGRDGGALRARAALWLGAAADSAPQVEDVHLAICHAVTAALRLPCAGGDPDAARAPGSAAPAP